MTTFEAAAHRRGILNPTILGDFFLPSAEVDEADPGEAAIDSQVNGVSDVLDHFREKFPDFHYDHWREVAAVNARSFIDAGKRYVVIYGGLTRARGFNKWALYLTLAHETGHHLGKKDQPAKLRRRDPLSRMIYESDCDYWAALIGFEKALPDPDALPFDVPKAENAIIHAAKRIYRMETRNAAPDPPAICPRSGIFTKGHPHPDCRYRIFYNGAKNRLRENMEP